MKVLLIDDEAMVLSGLRRALMPHREELQCHFAETVDDALALLEREPFDVVVSDMRMPVMDGAQLLQIVADKYPATLRIILSGQTGEEAAMRAVPVAHQFLSKPCPVEALIEAIHRGSAQREAQNRGHGLASLVGRVGSLPAPPDLFLQLGRVMADPRSNSAAVSAVLQRSPVVVAKLLQLVNTSFFAAPQRIVSLDAAVARLGLRLVRAVVLTEGVFADEDGHGVYSIADQRRGRSEAATAMAAAQAMAGPGAMRDTAVTASLLANIGTPLLATVAPELATWIRDAVAGGADPLMSELNILGTTHAAFASHILTLWNLPVEVVDAVAKHHDPQTEWGAPMVTAFAWAIAEHRPIDLEAAKAAGAPANALSTLQELQRIAAAAA
jgi:HD-like signal output (HDOD) protein